MAAVGRTLAILKATSEPGSDALNFNFQAPTNRGIACLARVLDFYRLSSVPPKIKADDEEEEKKKEYAAPTTIKFEAKMEWRRKSHTATLKKPYSEMNTLGGLFQRWSGHHQKKIDAEFDFLSVTPSLIYDASINKAKVTLPPGASLYTTDAIFWRALGFNGDSIEQFETGPTPLQADRLFGFRNRGLKTIKLRADRVVYPGEKVRSVMKTAEVETGLRNHNPDSVALITTLDTAVTVIAEESTSRTLTVDHLETLLSAIAGEITARLNVKSEYLSTVVTDDGRGVALETQHDPDLEAVLTLTPSPETATALGVSTDAVKLFFGLEDERSEALKLSTKMVLSAPAADKATGAADDGPNKGGGANYVNDIAPFSLIMPGQKGNSFIQNWGQSPVAAYFYKSSSSLSSVPIQLAGDQSSLIVKLIRSDLTQHVFKEAGDFFLTLELMIKM